METTLYIAVSRQNVLRRDLDTIANNMANASTPGYKGEALIFAEHPVRGRAKTPLSFVGDPASVRNLTEGSFTRTGNQLDAAIHGDGWFVVETEQGERYTRNGHFRLDRDGRLVTTQGNPVLGQGGPITFQPTDAEVRLAGDGTFYVGEEPRGRIRVVTFDNAQELKNTANNLLSADAAATDASNYEVVQGMIEDSNVQPVLEIAKMITGLRSYQAAQRMIDTEHDRQRKAIEVLTRTNQ